MSALQRARSRSKTAPETSSDLAESSETIPTSTIVQHDPSSKSPPSRIITSTIRSVPTPKIPTAEAAMILSSLPVSNLPISEPQGGDAIVIARDGLDDPADNRSSSLSELGDASDEHSEATPRASAAVDLNENDSEAETERLETTPRKATRTGTNAAVNSEQLYERTPSKLVHSRTVEQAESPPASSPTHSAQVEDVETGGPVHANAGLDSLSSAAASEAASLAEIVGKKRKRSSAESSSVDDSVEEPARKRNSTVKDTRFNGSQEVTIDTSEQLDMENELDRAEERISQLAQEEAELEERQADVAEETVSELTTVAKLTKPRKGGRRGKRKLDDTGGTAEAAAHGESLEGDVDGDGDNEEEDSGAPDEEVAKKKNAIDELAKIEKKFKIFREKLCDEQIARCEQELEMLKQPNCTHPEYLAMVQCIDDRRAGKLAYEKKLMEYKQQCLERQTVAGRHQLQSQYFQTVRDIREDVLSECNQRIYELQRGRRQLGVDEVEYFMRMPEKRSEQIRQQAAYNLEVSILSGVAKYVGFPAAPDIKSARPSEIEDDLRAMKITTRPAAQPNPYVRSYNRNTTADEAAAEEQFIERTPWANPQHPAHQQTHYQGGPPGPSRAPSYQTPAGQRRIVDVHAPNGSASTIDMISNPPSSTAGQGPHSTNSRIGGSESPVMHMKRHPSDHQPHTDTPTSNLGPRNFANTGRESYASNVHTLSSPAPAHVELPPEEQGPRWAGNGMRPSPVSAVVGRQVPLSQRSSLGAVSVVSGNALFGR